MQCLKINQPISKCLSRELLSSLLQTFRSRTTGAVADVKSQVELNPKEKVLKVVLVGKTNAGKSTLINSIMNLKICDVSLKAHTTLKPFRTAFVSGNTQIIFVDTPGLTSRKEVRKYALRNKIPEWKNVVFDYVDIIAVVHDVSSRPGFHFKLHNRIEETLKILAKQKPIVLIANKMDLVDSNSRKRNLLTKLYELKKNVSYGDNITFSEVFPVSALKNEGVNEFKDFLLEKAVPGKWVSDLENHHEVSLIDLISKLTRAEFLNLLRQEIPYTCKYEVEYLEEDELGVTKCMIIVTCAKARHVKIILGKRSNVLPTVVQNLISNLFFITGKQFKIKIFVKHKDN